jgi:hypothetical protein
MKTLGINGEFSQHVDMPHYPSPLKNNSENSRKMYYNTLRVINGEFSQQGGLPSHLMPRHLSQLKNNSGKCIFAN